MRTAILASLIFALQPAPGVPQSSPPRWSLGSRPLVSIGENMEDTLILGAVSAIRLTTGQIVVASSKNSRVLWFDARGNFVRGFGRRGRGPGEFGPDLSLYGLPGDTIVVHDAANRRFHYIPPNATDTRIEQRGEGRLRIAYCPSPCRSAMSRAMRCTSRWAFCSRPTIVFAPGERGVAAFA